MLRKLYPEENRVRINNGDEVLELAIGCPVILL
ncbi:unnamed protein product, partial [Allacma fusca]